MPSLSAIVCIRDSLVLADSPDLLAVCGGGVPRFLAILVIQVDRFLAELVGHFLGRCRCFLLPIGSLPAHWSPIHSPFPTNNRFVRYKPTPSVITCMITFMVVFDIAKTQCRRWGEFWMFPCVIKWKRQCRRWAGKIVLTYGRRCGKQCFVTRGNLVENDVTKWRVTRNYQVGNNVAQLMENNMSVSGWFWGWLGKGWVVKKGVLTKCKKK